MVHDDSMLSNTVYLYVCETMSDWEPGYAIAAINNPIYHRDPGAFTVRTAGPTAEPVTTAGGVRILPDIPVADIPIDGTAMLILVGAGTWESGPEHAAALAKAGELLDAGVPVAAICGATFGLASAGLLDDRAHTSNAAEYVAASGYAGAAGYRSEPAVTDGDLITASGTQPVDFARHILTRLDIYKDGALDEWYGLYTSGDAKHFFALMEYA